MFSDILERYQQLISKCDELKTIEIIKHLREINAEKNKLLIRLETENKNAIELLAKKHVTEFINSSGNAKDFFETIDKIRSQTQIEEECKFNAAVSQWKLVLDNAEKYLALIIKQRLDNENIYLGSCSDLEKENDKIEWIVMTVDPLNNYIQLLAKKPVGICCFQGNGYTDIEDEDDFGCAESACSWSKSDLFKYLNSDFYMQTFTDAEKEIILKCQRHVNKGDFLIPNDISENYVYVPTLDEFLMLDKVAQCCEEEFGCDIWWLCEQKNRGWDDTGELPQIYAIECGSGILKSITGNKKGLVRPVITVDLDKLIIS